MSISTDGAHRLPIFIINLGRRPDRMRRISESLTRMELAFVRIEAVDGSSIEMRLPENPFLTPSSVANWLSHRIAYSLLSSSQAKFGLILEDDANLAEQSLTLEKLTTWAGLMERNNLHLLQVGYISSIYGSLRPRAILDRVLAWRSGRALRDSQSKVRYVQGEFRAGSHAYLISKDMATYLRESNSPPTLSSDAFLESIARHSQHPVFARLARSAIEQESRFSSNSQVDSDIQ